MLNVLQHCLHHQQPDLLTVLIWLSQQAGQASLMQLLLGADHGPQHIVHEDAVYEITVRRIDAPTKGARAAG